MADSWSMFDRSVSQTGDPRRRTMGHPPGCRVFVAGISGLRPKTRASVTERTWAYQTKSAFSDIGGLALFRPRFNEHRLEHHKVGPKWSRKTAHSRLAGSTFPLRGICHDSELCAL